MRFVEQRFGDEPVEDARAGRPALTFSTTLAYAAATLCLFGGTAVMLGLGLPPGVPVRMRMLLGAVLVLLGLYRLAITWTKRLQQEEDDV